MVKLNIDQIKFDETTYPRSGIDWRTTYKYQRSMSMGDKFPPITVAKLKKAYILVDGYHRLEASRNIGSKQIDVEVIECGNLNEVFIESLKRNISHGRPLSMYEKLVAAVRLKGEGMTMKRISDILHMPRSDIEHLMDERVEDGVVKRAPVSNVEVKSGSRGVFESESRIFADSSQVHLLKQVIVLIENYYLNVDNREVADLVVKLKRLLGRVRLPPKSLGKEISV